MTTTAHEDQFTVGTQTIEPVRELLSKEAILRRNIADVEKEMQRQAERAESYAETLRSIASYVGAGGYNADTVDAGVFEEKVRWGIGEIMARMERAEAELAKLAQQKPIKYLYRVIDCFGHDVLRDDPRDATIIETIPLYAAHVPAPHKGATHCDDCGLTWLDDGLNPLGCPYCKALVPAPAVPAEWREVMAELAADAQAACDAEHPHRDQYPSVMRKYNNDMEIVEKARALLQSAEVTK